MRAIVVALLIAACNPPQTAAEACRRQNAGNRFSRGLNRQNSAVADAVEDARCDAIEREERAEARERSAANAKAVAARREELARTRREPSTPELGATPAEVRVLCERQRGVFQLDPNGVFGCRVGGPLAFAGVVRDGRVVRVDGYFEGADLATTRARVSESMGPPTSETVSPEGFRVFVWEGTRAVVVTMYANGVRVSVSAP